jgi:hypothetical protein
MMKRIRTARAGRLRWRGLALLPLLLLAAGCGGAADATSTPATLPVATVAAADTATSAPAPATAAPAAATETATPLAAAPKVTDTAGVGEPPPPLYAHSDNYSMLAGQLQQKGACWVITYVSPLVDIVADKYNNHFALIRGGRWNPDAVKDGAWVVVHGKPAAGPTAETCDLTGYEVTSLDVNPRTPVP